MDYKVSVVDYKVSVAALIKASEKNGFEWAHGPEHPGDVNRGPYSCVVGQGIRNLGGSDFPTDFESMDPELLQIFENIYVYNDTKAESYEDAFAYMKKKLFGYGKKKIPIGWK